MREMLWHGGSDMAQLGDEIPPDHPIRGLDGDRDPLAAGQRDKKIENMTRGAAIGAAVGDRGRLFLDVMDIRAQQRQAKKAVFQHTFEMDDTRAFEGGKFGNHAAAQARPGTAHNVPARAARFRRAVDQGLGHMGIGARVLLCRCLLVRWKRRFRLLSDDAGIGPAGAVPAG